MAYVHKSTVPKVWWPRFSLNAKGTRVNITFPFAAGTSQPSVPGALVMNGWPWSKDADPYMFSLERDKGDVTGSSSIDNKGFSGTLRLGYAITANNPANGNATLPTQADFVSLGTQQLVPHDPSNENMVLDGVVTKTGITGSFAMPQQPSALWIGYKLSGASPSAFLWSSPDVWYSNANLTEVGPEVELDYPHLPTWYAPSITVSASPSRVTTGNTATLTITAPAGLRDLVASDFSVVGGSLSNFTKVS